MTAKLHRRRAQGLSGSKNTGPRPAVIETVERRQMLSVSLNSAGWSVVTPSSSAHVVYVSSSHGSDKNSGLSASAPVQSLAAATALVRNNSDDELLLDRGDTWTTSFPVWTKSGLSAQQPLLIGTYGTGNRPVIDTGTGSGLICDTKSAVNYLMVDGLVFDASGRDPMLGTVSAAAAAAAPYGFELLGPSTGVTIEDSSFSYYGSNIVVEGVIGTITNVTIRRSTDTYAYCTSAHAEGLYAASMDGLTIDQDVFDHNGWDDSVAGAVQTGYDHDIYCYDTVQGLTVTNSVIARASYCGVLARGGGVIDGNLFLDDGFAISFGNANGAQSLAGGVSGQIENNVFIVNHDIPGGAGGGGIELGNLAPGAGVTVSGNVFADDTENNQAAISLTWASSTDNPADCVGINDLTISDNIVDGWHTALSISAFTDGGTGISSLNGLTVEDNQFQSPTSDLVAHGNAYSSKSETWAGNDYYSAGTWFTLLGSSTSASAWKLIDRTGTDTQLAYVDPSRTEATYSASLGAAGTEDAYLAAADAMSDTNWIAAYTGAATVAYIKAGFAVAVPAPTTGAGTTSDQLTGTVIGTSGSYGGLGNVAAKAEDGSTSTFFDGPTANGDWVGLDLGSAKQITSVEYASRSGFASRMDGGTFQASNSATFSTGVVTLATIGSSANPSSSSLTTQAVTAAGTYRYVRYLSPTGSFGDVSEVRFFGPAAGLTQRTGATIGTAGSYQNDGNTMSKAIDGSTFTYFDGATANGNWVGLDLGSPQSISQITFTPRTGFASRMVGGVFQVSTTADFSSGVTAIATITATPSATGSTTITLAASVTARYVRYLSPNGSYGDVAEVAFYG
jgi:hypothetical protein